VAAYVRKNFIPTDQIAGLINAVHSTLSGLANEVVEEPPRVPAVSVRRSVRPDHIICIDCGYRGKMLKRHLHSRHGLSVDQYKLRWKLASNYPTTAPNYSERRSQLAKTTGLGRRRAQPPAMPAPAPVMTPEKPARRAANKATGTRPGVKAAKPKTTATARKAGPRTSGKTASNRSRSRNSSSRVASKGASTRRAATSS
jgi:predicted transcriptional regulator